jgi:hypothetical protein
VCKNQRIYRHKTFKGLAQRGVSSCGWFYGFKLHLITNNLDEIVSFAISKGNISDRKEVFVLKIANPQLAAKHRFPRLTFANSKASPG